MLRTMTWSQLRDWMEYAQVEPLEPSHQQTAHLVSTLANIHRKSGTKAYGIEEFVLSYGGDGDERPEKAQTPEEQKALCMMLAQVFNA